MSKIFTLLTILMSCFDVTTCATNQIFTGITCNFTIAYVYYSCNSTNTCLRGDGLYDCCTSNITECIIEQLQLRLIPTTTPTIYQMDNYDSRCEITCNLTPSSNACYWYENQNRDNSCINKDNQYCCSHKRDDCCHISIEYACIVFGSLFLLITCLYYKYFVFRYTRVVHVPEAQVEVLL